MSALSRMQAADPVPDESRLLADPNAMEHFVRQVQATIELIDPEVEDHSKASGIRSRQTGSPGLRSKRPTHGLQGITIAVGAAALTLLLFSATLALIQGEPGESAPALSDPDPIHSVESAYTALNSGDIDHWLAHFADDALIFGQTKALTGELYAVLSAANHKATPTGPCQQLETEAADESVVTCTVTESNDFHGRAGISLTREEVFTVTEQDLITEATARVLTFTQPGYYAFNKAFFDWLRSAHPTVHAEIRPALTTHLPTEPDHMRTALEFLDEFLAQSERYPIIADERP
jgi:hypothetical protein